MVIGDELTCNVNKRKIISVQYNITMHTIFHPQICVLSSMATSNSILSSLMILWRGRVRVHFGFIIFNILEILKKNRLDHNNTIGNYANSQKYH